MEVKILHEEKNPLFNRKEIKFEVIHEGKPTPKLTDVKLAIAEKTGSDASHIIIDNFKTLFGIGRTVGNARIYKKMEELKDYEPEYLLKRNNLIQEKKEGESNGEKEEEGNKEAKED